jgi:hypothetical protein
VDEVLETVSDPVAAPVVIGSNCTLSTTVWLGFRVSGKVAPETEKPVPEAVAELTVTAAVPVELRVSDCVAGEFSVTPPKPMLPALMLSVGTPGPSWIAKVFVVLPALAVSVAVCDELTDVTVAENEPLVAPAATVTDVGTVTAELLLLRLTAKPPVAAAALSVTVQLSLPAPVIEPFVQLSPLSTGTPVPLKPTTVDVPVDELLVRVSDPVTAPAAVGSNCTVKVAV